MREGRRQKAEGSDKYVQFPADCFLLTAFWLAHGL